MNLGVEAAVPGLRCGNVEMLQKYYRRGHALFGQRCLDRREGRLVYQR
jgi:hypothetical protein